MANVHDDIMAHVDDVIQATESANEWSGCLFIVSEVLSWGVSAYMKVPNSGLAYVRLTHEQYEIIGEAVLVGG